MKKTATAPTTQYARVDYELTHFGGFFQLTHGVAGTLTVPFWGGYWEISSGDFPDYYDLDIFLGLLALFQDMRRAGKVAIGHPTDDRSSHCVKTSIRTICRYAGLSLSGQSVKRVRDALKRFTMLVAFKHWYHLVDGKPDKSRPPERMRTVRFVLYYDFERKTDNVAIDAEFLDYCENINKLLVRFRAIQNLGSQVEKAMLLYIEGNEKRFASGIPEERILKFMGLRKPVLKKGAKSRDIVKFKESENKYQSDVRERRRQIKSALDSFKSDGLIAGFSIFEKLGIRVYRIKKRG